MAIKKEYTYYYIYMVKNLINNKIYIGFHATNNEYDGYIGSGKLLQRAIKKYGINCFIKGILEYVNIKNWREKEIFWINKMKSYINDNGYNLTLGGEGTLGYEDSEKTKLKKSNSHRGEKNVMFGKTIYDVWLKKYGKEEADIKIIKLNKTHELTPWNKNKKCEQLSGEKNGNFQGGWHGSNPAFLQKGKTLEEIYGSEKAKNINYQRKLTKSIKILCPYCNKLVDKANLKRWHNENCKHCK